MSGICLQKIMIDGKRTQLFEDEKTGQVTGFVFSTGKYVRDPLSMLPSTFTPMRMSKTYEEVQEELEEMSGYPVLPLTDRKLRVESLERFGIKVGLSEEDGETPTTIHFPYFKKGELSAYKTKLISPKKFWSTGDMKGVDLFGWEQAIQSGSPKLFIVEGELDVPALYQILKDKNKGTKWAHLEPAVVSPPNGVSSAKATILSNLNEIERNFKDVVLALDMDEPGQEAVKGIVQILPQAKVAELPMKDAGECLIHGRSLACANSVLFKATKPNNTRLVKGSTLREAARTKPEWGLSFPWEGLTDLTRGRRRGETTYWGAGVKMGKSELVNALAEHIIVEHDSPVLIVKPEEALAKSYQMLVSKAAGKIFHDPKIEFDGDAFDLAEPKIGDKAIFIDMYQFVDWDTLKGDIKYAVIAEGVKDVMLDPITAFTNQMSSSEANEFLVSMTAELSAMAKDLDFSADIFCHLKAPQQGEPHERGGKVMSTQFAGSRAMMRVCNYMIGLEGNKDPSLDLELRNMRRLVVLEDREFGNTGIIDLYWDSHTGLFQEVKG